MGWGVGVVAALLANVAYSTGFVLEKRALSALPPLSTTRPARLLRLLLGSPLWLVGAVALAAGFAAQLVVYRTLPIAAAQGLFVSGLVLLLLLSSRVLGERASGRERAGIGLILCALVMVVASLRGQGAVGRTAATGTLLAICVPSLVAGVLLYGATERRARRPESSVTGVEYGVAVGLLYGVSSLAIKGVSGLLTTDGLGSLALTLLRGPYPYLLLFTGAAGLVVADRAAALPRVAHRAGVHDGDLRVHGGVRDGGVRRATPARAVAARAAARRDGAGGVRPADPPPPRPGPRTRRKRALT